MDEEKCVHIVLDEQKEKQIEICEMAGCDLSERNSFEEPFKVSPAIRTAIAKNGEIERFAAHIDSRKYEE